MENKTVKLKHDEVPSSSNSYGSFRIQDTALKPSTTISTFTPTSNVFQSLSQHSHKKPDVNETKKFYQKQVAESSKSSNNEGKSEEPEYACSKIPCSNVITLSLCPRKLRETTAMLDKYFSRPSSRNSIGGEGSEKKKNTDSSSSENHGRSKPQEPSFPRIATPKAIYPPSTNNINRVAVNSSDTMLTSLISMHSQLQSKSLDNGVVNPTKKKLPVDEFNLINANDMKNDIALQSGPLTPEQIASVSDNFKRSAPLYVSHSSRGRPSVRSRVYLSSRSNSTQDHIRAQAAAQSEARARAEALAAKRQQQGIRTTNPLITYENQGIVMPPNLTQTHSHLHNVFHSLNNMRRMSPIGNQGSYSAMASPSPRPSILQRRRPDQISSTSKANSNMNSSMTNTSPTTVGAKRKLDMNEDKNKDNNATNSPPRKTSPEVPRRRNRKQTFESETPQEQLRMSINVPVVSLKLSHNIINNHLNNDKKRRGRPKTDTPFKYEFEEPIHVKTSIPVNLNSPEESPNKDGRQSIQTTGISISQKYDIIESQLVQLNPSNYVDIGSPTQSGPLLLKSSARFNDSPSKVFSETSKKSELGRVHEGNNLEGIDEKQQPTTYEKEKNSDSDAISNKDEIMQPEDMENYDDLKRNISRRDESTQSSPREKSPMDYNKGFEFKKNMDCTTRKTSYRDLTLRMSEVISDERETLKRIKKQACKNRKNLRRTSKNMKKAHNVASAFLNYCEGYENNASTDLTDTWTSIINRCNEDVSKEEDPYSLFENEEEICTAFLKNLSLYKHYRTRIMETLSSKETVDDDVIQLVNSLCSVTRKLEEKTELFYPPIYPKNESTYEYLSSSSRSKQFQTHFDNTDIKENSDKSLLKERFKDIINNEKNYFSTRPCDSVISECEEALSNIILNRNIKKQKKMITNFEKLLNRKDKENILPHHRRWLKILLMEQKSLELKQRENVVSNRSYRWVPEQQEYENIDLDVSNSSIDEQVEENSGDNLFSKLQYPNLDELHLDRTTGTYCNELFELRDVMDKKFWIKLLKTQSQLKQEHKENLDNFELMERNFKSQQHWKSYPRKSKQGKVNIMDFNDSELMGKIFTEPTVTDREYQSIFPLSKASNYSEIYQMETLEKYLCYLYIQMTFAENDLSRAFFRKFAHAMNLLVDVSSKHRLKKGNAAIRRTMLKKIERKIRKLCKAILENHGNIHELLEYQNDIHRFSIKRIGERQLQADSNNIHCWDIYYDNVIKPNMEFINDMVNIDYTDSTQYLHSSMCNGLKDISAWLNDIRDNHLCLTSSCYSRNIKISEYERNMKFKKNLIAKSLNDFDENNKLSHLPSYFGNQKESKQFYKIRQHLHYVLSTIKRTDNARDGGSLRSNDNHSMNFANYIATTNGPTVKKLSIFQRLKIYLKFKIMTPSDAVNLLNILKNERKNYFGPIKNISNPNEQLLISSLYRIDNLILQNMRTENRCIDLVNHLLRLFEIISHRDFTRAIMSSYDPELSSSRNNNNLVLLLRSVLLNNNITISDTNLTDKRSSIINPAHEYVNKILKIYSPFWRGAPLVENDIGCGLERDGRLYLPKETKVMLRRDRKRKSEIDFKSEYMPERKKSVTKYKDLSSCHNNQINFEAVKSYVERNEHYFQNESTVEKCDFDYEKIRKLCNMFNGNSQDVSRRDVNFKLDEEITCCGVSPFIKNYMNDIYYFNNIKDVCAELENTGSILRELLSCTYDAVVKKTQALLKIKYILVKSLYTGNTVAKISDDSNSDMGVLKEERNNEQDDNLQSLIKDESIYMNDEKLHMIDEYQNEFTKIIPWLSSTVIPAGDTSEEDRKLSTSISINAEISANKLVENHISNTTTSMNTSTTFNDECGAAMEYPILNEKPSIDFDESTCTRTEKDLGDNEEIKDDPKNGTGKSKKTEEFVLMGPSGRIRELSPGMSQRSTSFPSSSSRRFHPTSDERFDRVMAYVMQKSLEESKKKGLENKKKK